MNTRYNQSTVRGNGFISYWGYSDMKNFQSLSQMFTLSTLIIYNKYLIQYCIYFIFFKTILNDYYS